MVYNLPVNTASQRMHKLLRLVVMGHGAEAADGAAYDWVPDGDDGRPRWDPIVGLGGDTGDPRIHYLIAPPNRQGPFLVFKWPETDLDHTMTTEIGLLESTFAVMVLTDEGSDPLSEPYGEYRVSIADIIWQRLRRDFSENSWQALLESCDLEDIFVSDRYGEVLTETRQPCEGVNVQVWWRPTRTA